MITNNVYRYSVMSYVCVSNNQRKKSETPGIINALVCKQ